MALEGATPTRFGPKPKKRKIQKKERNKILQLFIYNYYQIKIH